MNLRTSLLALTLASACICIAPSALAFQDTSSPPADQGNSQPPPREEGPEDHPKLRQDAHEAGQDIKEGARDVGHAVSNGVHHVGRAIRHTAHWRRYHRCTRYSHHHCVRWVRRDPD
jgi:hypothetical protein